MNEYNTVRRIDYEKVIKQRDNLMHEVDRLNVELAHAQAGLELVELLRRILPE